MIHSSKGLHKLQKGFKTLYVPINNHPACFGSATRGPSYWVICNLWGGGMFCDDIVESVNYVFKDNFLTTSSRVGGRKATKKEKDEAMLGHAHEHTFLYKEMPRRDGRRRREQEHVVHAQLEVGN